MSRITKLLPATIALGVLVAILFCTPAQSQVMLKLLGQLYPFEGGNRYADVWGEGNYAYLA